MIIKMTMKFKICSVAWYRINLKSCQQIFNHYFNLIQNEFYYFNVYTIILKKLYKNIYLPSDHVIKKCPKKIVICLIEIRSAL